MLKTPNILRPKGIEGFIVALFVGAVMYGCAQIPLHANLSDAELRARLDEHFVPGMTVSEVQAELDVLKVPKGQRLFYEAGAVSPPQLLARVFQPGGFWLDDEDQMVRWADAVFVFDEETPEARLERTETFRGSQRYWCGDPVNIPATPTKYPWRRCPVLPPPPLEPPVRELVDGR